MCDECKSIHEEIARMNFAERTLKLKDVLQKKSDKNKAYEFHNPPIYNIIFWEGPRTRTLNNE